MNEIIFYRCVLGWDEGVAFGVIVELLHKKAIALSHSQYPNEMLEGQNNF